MRLCRMCAIVRCALCCRAAVLLCRSFSGPGSGCPDSQPCPGAIRALATRFHGRFDSSVSVSVSVRLLSLSLWVCGGKKSGPSRLPCAVPVLLDVNHLAFKTKSGIRVKPSLPRSVTSVTLTCKLTRDPASHLRGPLSPINMLAASSLLPGQNPYSLILSSPAILKTYRSLADSGCY